MNSSVLERSPEKRAACGSRAGDILLLPVALAAFWTVAYQLVLIARWPAYAIVWLFFVIAAPGLFFAARLWRKTNATPLFAYRFHPSHILLFLLAIGCATAALFILRPNQDDVVYFHRALAQLLVLAEPILTRQTSVDVDAAAFSPVHLATSHEMLMAFAGHYLGIDPLYFYQVIGHAFAAFFVPFIFYWCVRRFGLDRWPAAAGALLAIGFLLIDSGGPAAFGNTVFGRMWQGKAIVWMLFLPVALALTYRFLCEGNWSDILWLGLLGLSGVGLSNTALYLIPATVGCACLAMLAVELVERTARARLREQLRRSCLLALPLAYPIAILALLKLDIIPKPIDLRGFGPEFIPWRQGIDYVVGRPEDHLRNMVIFAIPLLIVGGRTGLFLFFHVGAIWLLCVNPLLAHFWMKNILAACYFRLVYLLPLPLLCAMMPMAVRRWPAISRDWARNRLLDGVAVGVLAVFLVCVYSFRTLSIMPRSATLGWKSPLEYQLLRANTEFARAAGKYISHSKLLAPGWTASCELPLLFASMKIVAPRLVTHYFANAHNAREGTLRRMAQVFVEGEKTDDPKRAANVAASFAAVIKSGGANAVAAPESEGARVLAALQSIDPRWHRVLEAGGLILFLPNLEGNE